LMFPSSGAGRPRHRRLEKFVTASSSLRPDLGDVAATEVAAEQAHVDRVYAELAKADARAASVAAEGLARGRTDRTGDVRDEEMTGLFERDALMYAAARRRATLEKQYEGLFGGWTSARSTRSPGSARCATSVGSGSGTTTTSRWSSTGAHPPRRPSIEPRQWSRWVSCGAGSLRCSGSRVIGVEDDLMVPEAPEDLVVVGDGALMAALTRSRGRQMRDIVATIQAHQDAAIGPPHEESSRSAVVPAPARRWWRCTARHTCSTRSAAVSRVVGSSSWDRRRPTRHTSRGSCPAWARTRLRCAPWGTSSTG
jgi:hypothetical protein